MDKPISRRKFLQLAGAGAAGTFLSRCGLADPTPTITHTIETPIPPIERAMDPKLIKWLETNGFTDTQAHLDLFGGRFHFYINNGTVLNRVKLEKTINDIFAMVQNYVVNESGVPQDMQIPLSSALAGRNIAVAVSDVDNLGIKKVDPGNDQLGISIYEPIEGELYGKGYCARLNSGDHLVIATRGIINNDLAHIALTDGTTLEIRSKDVMYAYLAHEIAHIAVDELLPPPTDPKQPEQIAWHFQYMWMKANNLIMNQ